MSDSEETNPENAGDERFQSELDEYDLLSSGPPAAGPLPDVDLSGTARAFNTRIRRRKQAQEVASGEAEKAALLRHALMIKGLVSIRKSLREVVRIDLGDRFRFALEADDWMGWPRITVKLLDSEAPEGEFPQLCVTAHDRQAKGAIEIAYTSAGEPARISLNRESDLMRLPKLLRTCVRAYLDLIGDVILEADRAEADSEENYLAQQDISAFEEGSPAAELSRIEEDLFEEGFEEDIFDSLPSLSDVEELVSTIDFDGKD